MCSEVKKGGLRTWTSTMCNNAKKGEPRTWASTMVSRGSSIWMCWSRVQLCNSPLKKNTCFVWNTGSIEWGYTTHNRFGNFVHFHFCPYRKCTIACYLVTIKSLSELIFIFDYINAYTIELVWMQVQGRAIGYGTPEAMTNCALEQTCSLADTLHPMKWVQLYHIWNISRAPSSSVIKIIT